MSVSLPTQKLKPETPTIQSSRSPHQGLVANDVVWGIGVGVVVILVALFLLCFVRQKWLSNRRMRTRTPHSDLNNATENAGANC